MLKIKDEVKQKIVDKTYHYGQEHVFQWWEELTDIEKNNLLTQLLTVDFPLMESLIEKHIKNLSYDEAKKKIEPAEIIPIPKTTKEINKAKEAKIIGEKALKDGKIAILLAAGGQSSRLEYNPPKGTYKIGPVTGKTLFQFHAEKIIALQKKYDVEIPWYILTSEFSNQSTKDFFEEEDFFQVKKDNIIFLEQAMIPALDFNGKLIMDTKDHFFENPNGHGGALLAIKESGGLAEMKKQKIEHIFYFQVDNVLAKICDPIFIGYHIMEDTEMSIKVVAKTYPEEKVGVLGYIDGNLGIIEYMELTPEQRDAKDSKGYLKFNAGSIGIHVLNVDFVERLTYGGFKLPYHAVKRKIPYLDKNGKLLYPNDINGIKFETFIFDALSEAKRALGMEVKREKEFSPLKNKKGENSPDTVRQSLLNLYTGWIEQAGMKIPSGSLIEVSPLFAIERESFLEKASKLNKWPLNGYFSEESG